MIIYKYIYINPYTNMPEGPEVKIMADKLNQLLRGKCLQSIKILSGPYCNSETNIYAKTRQRVVSLNQTIKKKNRAVCFSGVHSKGKFIYFKLVHLERCVSSTARIVEKGQFCFGSSLGLKGKWTSEPQPAHVRFELKFTNKPAVKANDPPQTLWYVDSLSQGKFNIESPDWLDKKLSALGPDVLGPDNPEEFVKNMKTKKAQKLPIFEALMDQTLVSGIGNYLRAEILYDHSQFSPFALVASITDQLVDLWKSARKTAAWFVQNGVTEQNQRVYKKSTAPNGKAVKTVKGKNNRVFYYT